MERFRLTVLSGPQTVAQYSTTPSVPIVISFPVSGAYTVLGTYISSTQTLSGTLAINVVEHSFTTDPAVWVGKSRNWGVPLTNIVVDADPRLMMVRVGAPINNAQNFSLMIDQNEPRYVVSRVRLGGPILNAARADGFRLFTTEETYNKVIEQYADGSRLVETMEVLSPVPTSITVRVTIHVGGVTFDDGTTYKELMPADFDALGQYRLRFIMPAGVETANCHLIEVVQGPVSVGVHH